MQRPQSVREPSTATRKDRWASFRGLAWWEIVLTVLPLGLVAVGGLIGGLFGGAGVAINLALAKRRMGAGLEVAAMLGVLIAAFILYFVVAVTIRVLAH